MSDIHEIFLKKLVETNKIRVESHLEGGKYQFYWDQFAVAKPLNIIFLSDLSRQRLYKVLQAVSQTPDHRFCDWLPPKVKLAFMAAVERDCKMAMRGRIEMFYAEGVRASNESHKAVEMIDDMKNVADSGGGSNAP